MNEFINAGKAVMKIRRRKEVADEVRKELEELMNQEQEIPVTDEIDEDAVALNPALLEHIADSLASANMHWLAYKIKSDIK